MITKLCTGIFLGVVGAASMLPLAGCSSTDAANDKAWDEATSACERQERTDQREACWQAAMQKYQATKKLTNTSDCPKSTC